MIKEFMTNEELIKLLGENPTNEKIHEIWNNMSDEDKVYRFMLYHYQNLEKRRLPFQFVPPSRFGKSLRSLMPAEWRAISSKVRKDANYTCAYCGEQFEPDETDAHEEWDFAIETVDGKDMPIQKLKDIKCVCKKCHMTAHPGANAYFGAFENEEIIENYMNVNGITDVSEVEADYRAARVVQKIDNYENWDFEKDVTKKVKEKYLGIIDF